MRNTATHRASGRSLTPLGKLPNARSVVGGVMLAGILSTGAAATATAAPTWPTCDGDGIRNNCPPLGEAADTSNSEPNAVPAGSTAVSASTVSGSSIAGFAQQAIGTPYSWGDESLAGMDCSGLVTWAYEQAGIDLNGNRTADQIMTGGQSIPLSEAQPGDLVGYKTGGSDYTHMGIYMGNDTIIDASNSNSTVVERSMWNEDWHAVTYR